MIHIKRYRDRVISAGDNVRVYRNLGNTIKETYSIQKKFNDRWLVAGHSDYLFLKEAYFKISEAGRKRVLKEGRKNVHSFIYGTLNFAAPVYDFNVKISYNPYKFGNFYYYCESSVVPVYKAKAILFRQDGVFAAL
jgi:hypothetical protein